MLLKMLDSKYDGELSQEEDCTSDQLHHSQEYMEEEMGLMQTEEGKGNEEASLPLRDCTNCQILEQTHGKCNCALAKLWSPQQTVRPSKLQYVCRLELGISGTSVLLTDPT